MAKTLSIKVGNRTIEPPDAMAGIFLGIASLHFVAPKAFEALVPRFLPKKRELVYASGVVEIACAAGLWRRWPYAGEISAGLLAAVFPANVQMALDAGSGKMWGPADNKLIAWGRLPLQLPMVWMALQARPKKPGRTVDKG